VAERDAAGRTAQVLPLEGTLCLLERALHARTGGGLGRKTVLPRKLVNLVQVDSLLRRAPSF
jgi:hypothetical protein